MSVKRLRRYLNVYSIDNRSCVEKSELIRLVQTTTVNDRHNVFVTNTAAMNFQTLLNDSNPSLPAPSRSSAASMSASERLRASSRPSHQPPRSSRDLPSSSAWNSSSSFSSSSSNNNSTPNQPPPISSHRPTNSIPPAPQASNQQNNSTSSNFGFDDMISDIFTSFTGIGEQPADTNRGPRNGSSSRPYPPRRSSPQPASTTTAHCETLTAKDLMSSGIVPSTLSARTIKSILELEGVAIPPNTIEKSDLIALLTRLLENTSQNSSSSTTTHDDFLCKICFENVSNCLLLECGHLVTCMNCARELERRAKVEKRIAECPICRSSISRTVQAFRA